MIFQRVGQLRCRAGTDECRGHEGVRVGILPLMLDCSLAYIRLTVRSTAK
jgi:hypothetical protein